MSLIYLSIEMNRKNYNFFFFFFLEFSKLYFFFLFLFNTSLLIFDRNCIVIDFKITLIIWERGLTLKAIISGIKVIDKLFIV
jgi:hypothetical protein